MAVSATKTITIVFTGDVTGTETLTAAVNAAAPGQIEIKTLATGANTITVPTGGTTPTGVTIFPPIANTQLITLKGVTGDTGVALHKTDPSYISIDSTVVNFVLNAAGTVTGCRFVWS